MSRRFLVICYCIVRGERPKFELPNNSNSMRLKRGHMYDESSKTSWLSTWQNAASQALSQSVRIFCQFHSRLMSKPWLSDYLVQLLVWAVFYDSYELSHIFTQTGSVKALYILKWSWRIILFDQSENHMIYSVRSELQKLKYKRVVCDRKQLNGEWRHDVYH